MAMSFLEWSAIVLVVLINIYLYGTCFYMYMNKRGVKNTKPIVPYFGDFYGVVRRKENLIQAIDKVYKQFPGERYVGFFEVVNEIILLKDVELIREVCVEAADHFLDHRNFFSENETSLFGKHLFSLKGQKWRDMRAAMEPAFSSNKMHRVFSSILNCAENATSHLTQQITQSRKEIYEVEIKKLFLRYVNDVIALYACACNVDSLKNPNNEIYSNAQKISQTEFLQFANIMAYSSKLLKLLDFIKPEERASVFFRALILKMAREREQKTTTANDFIQYLVDVKNGSSGNQNSGMNDYGLNKGSFKREWTDDDFVAQAISFFIGGHTTISTLMTFLVYELAVNTKVQEKLCKEINEVKLKYGSKIDFEGVSKIQYLDMIISETLRKWPPIIATDRECVKPYTLPPASEEAKTYTFLSKYAVWIPIYSIHHDPQHFSSPEIFEPERFSKDNKALIKPYTFIPFGVGPRNCIGMHFAICVVKITIFNLLSRFEFLPVSKTESTPSFSNDGLRLRLKNDCWLGIKIRGSDYK